MKIRTKINLAILMLTAIPVYATHINDLQSMHGLTIGEVKPPPNYDDSDSLMGEDGQSYPQYLMNIEQLEKSQLAKSINKKADPQDTHIQKNLSSIKLAIKFKPLSKVIPDENIIGYAPQNTYKSGWTGIIVYFKSKDLGVCTYTKNISKAMTFDKDKTTFDINNKPTIRYVEGDDEKGYLYTIDWAEEMKNKNVLSHTLECARLDKNDTVLNNMILLASRIDKA